MSLFPFSPHLFALNIFLRFNLVSRYREQIWLQGCSKDLEATRDSYYMVPWQHRGFFQVSKASIGYSTFLYHMMQLQSCVKYRSYCPIIFTGPTHVHGSHLRILLCWIVSRGHNDKYEIKCTFQIDSCYSVPANCCYMIKPDAQNFKVML